VAAAEMVMVMVMVVRGDYLAFQIRVQSAMVAARNFSLDHYL
jgi:hypothetical protein